MKRMLAPLAAAALVATLAVPAHAQDDPLSLLRQLSQQEQTQTRQSGVSTVGSGAVVVPDTASVAMDVDSEAGATHEERLAGYISRLEATGAADFDTAARLGLAWHLAGDHGKARSALEEAITLEPGAQSLYDTLARSMVNLETGIKVYVNGKRINFDAEPTIVSGRTLVPIRAVTEALGAQVDWDPVTSIATVTLGGTRVEVTKQSLTARVNGQNVQLDVAATIIGNRLMLPLRFVSENLNAQVDAHLSGTPGSMVISVVPN